MARGLIYQRHALVLLSVVRDMHHCVAAMILSAISGSVGATTSISPNTSCSGSASNIVEYAP